MGSRKTLVLTALFALTSALPASAQETIKIGSSLGLTGYGSATDGHWRDGLTVAIEAVNKQGGVLGKKLEFVTEDNKSTPQQAVVVYRKMMSEDKVVAFDSGCISAGNFAAASFVSKAKLPMFLCSILPRQPDEIRWAFQFLPPPKFEVDTRYQYLKEKTQIRKVGILSDPSPYSMAWPRRAPESSASKSSPANPTSRTTPTSASRSGVSTRPALRPLSCWGRAMPWSLSRTTSAASASPRC